MFWSSWTFYRDSAIKNLKIKLETNAKKNDDFGLRLFGPSESFLHICNLILSLVGKAFKL